MKFSTIATTTIALLAADASAFAPITIQQTSVLSASTGTSTSINMAGFGGGGGMGGGSKTKGKGKKSANTKKSNPVLKPKGQWDRYAKMKKANGVRVACRVVVKEGDNQDWYEVGRIKSEENEFTEMAVMTQRGIIAEHAKRLYPLQFRPKDQVEWGYASTPTPAQEDWVPVEKSAVADAPAGIEKKIGFEGKPDVGTGFYCHYQEGRLVDRYDEGKSLAKE